MPLLWCNSRFAKACLVPIFILLAVVSLIGAETGIAAQEEQRALKFRWAFGALSGEGNSKKLEPVTQDRPLKSGDRLKMLVELEQKCFVYLVHQNPQGELRLLFPYKLEQFNSDYEVARQYYVPKGNTWFELDAARGQESFYLLASGDRLSGLETLLAQYDAGDAVSKPDLAKQVVAEIRNLRKQARELSTPAERPVTIGGAIRGLEKPKEQNAPDLAALAQEISATGFYAKTFTIDHQ